MKLKFTILLMCIFATFANVKAQVWTFDTDGDTEGWNPGNTATGDVAGGALTWTWGAHNTPKWTKTGLSLSTDDYKKILVRLKNPNAVEVSTSTNSARVVTTTDGSSGTKFFAFTHSSSDTEFHTYIINVGADPAKFNGTVTSVQIQGMRAQEVPGGSLSLSEFRLIAAPNTWTGAVSTEWDVAGNWSESRVPSGEEVTIPNMSNQPVISTADAIVADLTLEEGAIVAVSGGQTLTVLRDVVASGAGTGYVTVGSGSSLVTYGDVSGTNHVFGRTTTFDNSTGKYSVVGSPVAGASTAGLGNLVYSYDESTHTYVEVISPQTMAGGDAYFSAFTGDVSFTGTPHTGTVSIPLMYEAGDGSNAGFNLVSNPYPSAIDFDQFVDVANNPDIDGTIYLWDDGGSNAGQRPNSDFITINSIGTASAGSSRSGDWNGNIGSGQGFFVKANTAGMLNFDNEMKVAGNNADANYFRSSNENSIQSIRVSLTSAEGVINQALLGFLPDATVGYDRLYDAYKMDGVNGVRIYSLLDDQPMSIQGMPIIEGEQVIPLSITATESGSYTLGLDYLNNWPTGMNVYIEDLEENKVVDFAVSGPYSFYSGSVVGSQRFNLILTSNKILSVENLENKGIEVLYNRKSVTLINSNNELENAQVSILDLSGRVMFNHEFTTLQDQVTLDYNFDSNKVYVIRVTSNTKSYFSKIIFK